MIGPGVRAAGALLCVFGFGLVSGLAIERHLGSESPVVAIGSAEEHARRMDELRSALDLDDAQMQRIHELMMEHQDSIQVLWEQLRPEVQAAMQDVHVEISELLRPEQRQLFHEWLMRHQEADAPARHH